jgi:hypothetical protein
MDLSTPLIRQDYHAGRHLQGPPKKPLHVLQQDL